MDALEAKMREAIDLRHRGQYEQSYKLHKQLEQEAPADWPLRVQNCYNLADVARRIGWLDIAAIYLKKAVVASDPKVSPHSTIISSIPASPAIR